MLAETPVLLMLLSPLCNLVVDMASIFSFVDAPSGGLLDKCLKEQLLRTAEHFGIDVAGHYCKTDIMAVLATGLVIRSL